MSIRIAGNKPSPTGSSAVPRLRNTLAFPLTFSAVTIATILIHQLIPHNSDADAFVVDGILLAVPLAVLAWPAHSVTAHWLSQAAPGLTTKQWVVVSAIAGGLVPFVPSLLKLALPHVIGDRLGVLLLFIYWGSAASLTGLEYSLVTIRSRHRLQ
ncbi:MAG: hypothetical protein ACREK8_00790 [Gemmatimonadales bacterium]